VEYFFEIRDEVNKHLDESRQNKVIGNSLEAKLRLIIPRDAYQFLSRFNGELKEFLLVSEIELLSGSDGRDTIEVDIAPLEYNKCQRCWMYSPTVGKNEKYPDLCERCVEVVENIDRGE